MNFDFYFNFFDNYVKQNYDLIEPLIRNKYEHTLRVARIIFEISSIMGLSDEDKKLAYFIGLCHDLGRFHEIVRNRTFNNLKFDHAAYSNKILFNDHVIDFFNFDKETELLIRKSLYFHNKKDIYRELSDRESLFVKLIRDADKIDIINMMSAKGHKFLEMPSQRVLDDFLLKQSIDLKNLKTKSDRVLLYLGFASNLYFRESKVLLNEYGYLDNYVGSVNVSFELKEFYDYLVLMVTEDIKKDKVYIK